MEEKRISEYIHSIRYRNWLTGRMKGFRIYSIDGNEIWGKWVYLHMLFSLRHCGFCLNIGRLLMSIFGQRANQRGEMRMPSHNRRFSFPISTMNLPRNACVIRRWKIPAPFQAYPILDIARCNAHLKKYFLVINLTGFFVRKLAENWWKWWHFLNITLDLGKRCCDAHGRDMPIALTMAIVTRLPHIDSPRALWAMRLPISEQNPNSSAVLMATSDLRNAFINHQRIFVHE